jgi:hypothetical protein
LLINSSIKSSIIIHSTSEILCPFLFKMLFFQKTFKKSNFCTLAKRSSPLCRALMYFWYVMFLEISYYWWQNWVGITLLSEENVNLKTSKHYFIPKIHSKHPFFLVPPSAQDGAVIFSQKQIHKKKKIIQVFHYWERLKRVGGLKLDTHAF